MTEQDTEMLEIGQETNDVLSEPVEQEIVEEQSTIEHEMAESETQTLLEQVDSSFEPPKEEKQKRFLTVVADDVVNQKGTDKLGQALSCLAPTSKKSMIYCITKDNRAIPIISGKKSGDTFEWAWRSKNYQEYNDRTNRYKLPVLSAVNPAPCKRHSSLLSIFKSKEEEFPEIVQDREKLECLSTKKFISMLKTAFEQFTFTSEKSKAMVKEFVNYCAKRDAEFESRKTNVKVNCEKCGRCGERHTNYSVKLDSHKVPYVICGVTNKRVDILLNKVEIDTHSLHSLRDIMFGTVFTIVSGSQEEIQKLKSLL